MSKSGSKEKIRKFLLARIGQVVTSAQIRKAAGNPTEWARRVRELRNEEGYQILTNNDRDDLKPGQYLLLNPTPRPAFERGISKETRAYVLDRNGFTCQMCGKDDPFNLRAICSVCNEGASNLTLEKPSALKLLAQIRRAKSSDQLEVLKWLSSKYPSKVKPACNIRKTIAIG